MTDHPVPRSDFYVYALFLEDGETPFYIGKGCGNRIDVHDLDARKRPRYRKDNIIRDMWARGVAYVPRMKLAEGLTNDMANRIEMDLIRLVGRMPNGPLANHTDGGDGTINMSPESKARQTEANKRSWADPEIRAKRVSGMKAAWTPEIRASFGAKKKALLTPELQDRITTALKAAYKRPEVQAKMSTAARKRAPAQSIAMKELWKDEEFRANHRKASAHIYVDLAYREIRRQIGLKRFENPDIRRKFMEGRQRVLDARTPEEMAKATEWLNSQSAIAKRAATNRLPEVREKRVAAQRAAFATPEAKAKRSAAAKKMWAERRDEIIRKRAAKKNH